MRLLAAAGHAVALPTEAAGSVLLVGFVPAACGALLLGGGPERARLLVAEGAVLALSFKTDAALLKTLDLPSWDRMAAFAAILALRTALKRTSAAEQAALAAAGGKAAPGEPDRPPPSGPVSPAVGGRLH